MIKTSSLITLLFAVTSLFSQELGAKFVGEGDRDLVKFFWLPESWPQELDGFFVKRKPVNNGTQGDWQDVNNTIIYPEISQDKSINNVETSPSEQQRLRDKLGQLISSGAMRPLSRSDYYTEVLSIKDQLDGVSFLLLVDYDLVLLNGFGLIDRFVPQADAYVYGLFPQINGQISPDPIETFDWTYGSSPDLQLDMTPTSKIRRKNINLRWEFDITRFRELELKGFYVYKINPQRDTTRLTDDFIVMTQTENPAFLTYSAPFEERDTASVYFARPITYFNTEGDASVLRVRPSQLVQATVPPVLQELEIQTDKINLAWEFPVDNNSAIQGFKVQRKKSLASPFEDVSDVIDANIRSFEDNNLNGPSRYIYRVIAITNQGLELWSKNEIIQYAPQKKIGEIENLKAEVVQQEGRFLIRFTWDYEGAESTQFRFFTDNPDRTGLAWVQRVDPIDGASYDYEVRTSISQLAGFGFAPVVDGKQGVVSDKIEVITPSKRLPFINLWPLDQKENIVTLNWEYRELLDLKGFRLYQNDEVILDENQLNGTSRQWQSAELDPGNYTYSIEAVSIYGVASQRSKPRKFKIE